MRDVLIETEETFSFKGGSCKKYQVVREKEDHYYIEQNYGGGATVIILHKDPVKAANSLVRQVIKDMKNRFINCVDNFAKEIPNDDSES